MRHGIITNVCLIALIGYATSGLADDSMVDDVRHQKIDRSFLLVSFEGVEAELVSSIRSALELDLLVPSAISVTTLVHQSFGSATEDLTGLLTKNEQPWLGVLVLCPADGGRTPTTGVFVTNSCGVVYLGALKQDLGLSEQDQIAFWKRVQKESIKAAALALGFAPCPFPRCALSSPETVAGLDAKGVNLCPPCYVQKQRFLLKVGLLPGCEQ